MNLANRQAKRAMALTLAFDVVTAGIAMAVTLTLRWTATGFPLPSGFSTLVAVASLAFVVSAAAAFYLMRIHRQVWRHMGLTDAIQVLQAVALSVLIFLPVVFFWNRLVGLPRSALVVAVAVWVAMLFIGRAVALARSTQRPLQFFQPLPKDATKALLIGDTVAAASVISKLRRENGKASIRILGLLQTGSAWPGRAIRGVPVLGDQGQLEFILNMLEARYGAVPWVAVTGEARDPKNMSEILEVTARLGAKVIAYPADGSVGEQVIRPRDLLARPERKLNPQPVEDLIRGARVLVTGGGGTIGLELARQCAAFEPQHLAILDAAEYNLYRADMQLRRDFPGLKLSAILGNVRDTVRLEQTFGEIQPDVVIHAAALKHVPLMEQHICEAILTNIEGAMNVTRTALKYGTRRMVFISTDKAVDPDNVMGATKRLAELAISRISQRGTLTPSLVRFGNVLGSSGSVVPLFKDQIKEGGPVTVTHPDVTRYFMTVEEASALVLQAASLTKDCQSAQLFVLDMGDPIRIEALAEAMIRMQGMVPGHHIDIVHTGLRPGEKLREQLIYDYENMQPTGVDGVSSIVGETHVDDRFDLMLASLLRAANRRERTEALHLLGRLVPEYGATLMMSDRGAEGA
ncbi:MAG: SDR family NAD(P)-dependent oxidoreductase [Pseudomonadota bacterium]